MAAEFWIGTSTWWLWRHVQTLYSKIIFVRWKMEFSIPLACRYDVKLRLGGGGGGGGSHRREMFFVGKILLTNHWKLKNLITQPQISIKKINTHPWSKTLQNDTIQFVTHVLYHFFCDMSLITACEIFCSLKFHVFCTCTFFSLKTPFLSQINKSENDQNSESNWFTYCIDITVHIAFQSPIFQWVMLWKWQ
jgi:hypothetical protein